MEFIRPPEYQAVLIIDNEDDRPLFPLTEPKCLLPICNKRLLAYQLDTLIQSGVAGTFINLSYINRLKVAYTLMMIMIFDDDNDI